MGKMKELWQNKWVKFSVWTIVYLLLTVVWTGNLWMLLGVAVIYDIYISRWMYRAFWKKHLEMKEGNGVYKSTMEWVEAIVFGVVTITLLRIFVFGLYLIPTPSMEKSLLVGDYLIVSRLAYGPTVPNTPLSFPMVHNTMPMSQTAKSYVEWIKWPYHRLKGFGNVKRNDVVVFNFPAGDTVILENQAVTYYDVLRDFQSEFGDEEGYRKLHSQYRIVSRPVDKRENYVKRAVGIPGDTIRIVESQLFVNGEAVNDIDGQQLVYFVKTSGSPISKSAFEEMGLSNSDVSYNQVSRTYVLPLTQKNFERVKGMSNVEEVKQYSPREANVNVFPHDAQYQWNEDNFGPIWVPKKGVTVELNAQTVPFYRDIIRKYEGNVMEERDGQVFINGQPAETYTFKMDYYFMMGDNRHNSADSRFWGYVPEDHVVGKASVICVSTDKEKSFFSGLRWNRLVRKVR